MDVGVSISCSTKPSLPRWWWDIGVRHGGDLGLPLLERNSLGDRLKSVARRREECASAIMPCSTPSAARSGSNRPAT